MNSWHADTYLATMLRVVQNLRLESLRRVDDFFGWSSLSFQGSCQPCQISWDHRSYGGYYKSAIYTWKKVIFRYMIQQKNSGSWIFAISISLFNQNSCRVYQLFLFGAQNSCSTLLASHKCRQPRKGKVCIGWKWRSEKKWMEEILYQLRLVGLSHHLEWFIHFSWCSISSINSSCFMKRMTIWKLVNL